MFNRFHEEILKPFVKAYDIYEASGWDLNIKVDEKVAIIVCTEAPTLLSEVLLSIQRGLLIQHLSAIKASLLFDRLYQHGFKDGSFKNDIQRSLGFALPEESIKKLKNGATLSDCLLQISENTLKNQSTEENSNQSENKEVKEVKQKNVENIEKYGLLGGTTRKQDLVLKELADTFDGYGDRYGGGDIGEGLIKDNIENPANIKIMLLKITRGLKTEDKEIAKKAALLFDRFYQRGFPPSGLYKEELQKCIKEIIPEKLKEEGTPIFDYLNTFVIQEAKRTEEISQLEKNTKKFPDAKKYDTSLLQQIGIAFMKETNPHVTYTNIYKNTSLMEALGIEFIHSIIQGSLSNRLKIEITPNLINALNLLHDTRQMIRDTEASPTFRLFFESQQELKNPLVEMTFTQEYQNETNRQIEEFQNYFNENFFSSDAIQNIKRIYFLLASAINTLNNKNKKPLLDLKNDDFNSLMKLIENVHQQLILYSITQKPQLIEIKNSDKENEISNLQDFIDFDELNSSSPNIKFLISNKTKSLDAIDLIDLIKINNIVQTLPDIVFYDTVNSKLACRILLENQIKTKTLNFSSTNNTSILTRK